MIERVPPSRPLTRSEEAVVALLAQGYSYRDIAKLFGISWITAKFHACNAAAKLPGDLPAQMRVIVWWLGATYAVLTREHAEDLYTTPTPEATLSTG